MNTTVTNLGEQQSSSQNDMHSFPEQGLVTQEDEQVQLAQRTFSQSTSRETHELDTIASSTNSWSVALSKTRMLTRWLELSGENSLTLAYLGETDRDQSLPSPGDEDDAAGRPETQHKEIQKTQDVTSRMEEDDSHSAKVLAVSKKHFLGYTTVKTTSTEQKMIERLSLRSPESEIVRNDSGHVQHIYSHATLLFPDFSQRPGLEVRGDQRQARLPQLGDKETRRIAQQHGTQVMMQPDTCYLMSRNSPSFMWEEVGLEAQLGHFWLRVPGQMLWSSLSTLETTKSCLTW